MKLWCLVTRVWKWIRLKLSKTALYFHQLGCIKWFWSQSLKSRPWPHYCLSVSVIHSHIFGVSRLFCYFCPSHLPSLFLFTIFLPAILKLLQYLNRPVFHSGTLTFSKLAGTMGRHADGNTKPCGLHCVNWLELVLPCPGAVFDVNMLEAWLSFVVIRLSAQPLSCWEGEKETEVCVCVCVSRVNVGEDRMENKRNWAWTSLPRPYTASRSIQ